jgi:hypothetical protein
MKQNPTSPIQCKTTTPRFLIAITLALACFALSAAPNAFGVVPAPDGGYPGFNTAEGQNALLHLTTGTANTAVGWLSLENVTTGSFNTGVGAGTLVLNSGEQNTATGAAALLLNTTGSQNTANGALALLNNTEGNFNTAIGANALQSNTTGFNNTANGDSALGGNTTGGQNTATGFNVLRLNTTGDGNTANGFGALVNNTTGAANIALGHSAGANLTTGNLNIDIGNIGVADESNTIRIGGGQTRTFIAGIRGRTTGIADAVPVLIDSAGQLGTTSSSRRFKNDIQPMDKASDALLALKPVTFHYKSDASGTPQFGLIAEEVAKVNPDLVVCDEKGEIYTVRYEAVNAMLLNEFLKEHRKVEQQGRKMQQQEASITQLKSTMAQQQKESQSIAAQQQKEIQALTTSLKEQASQIQKVSAQIEMNRPSPQTVVEN